MVIMVMLNKDRRCSAIGNEQDVCEPDEPTVTRQSAVQNSDAGTRNERPQRQWVKKDLHVDWPDFQVQPKIYIRCTDPVAMFEIFFDDGVCTFLANMSTKYAREDKGQHSLEFGVSDVRSFFGILLLSGYMNVPRW